MLFAFQKAELPLFILNFGTIILLLRKRTWSRSNNMGQFFFFNVSFKIFTKVATNRVSKVTHKVVSPSQTAFMPGWHILEGVVVLHETIHEFHRTKLDGILLKIDLKKLMIKLIGRSYNRQRERRVSLQNGVSWLKKC
jgi:hypothetical protein